MQELFEVARALKGKERAAWLAQHCTTGTEERELVLELLSAYEASQSDAFSETGIGQVRSTLEELADHSNDAETWQPTTIGPYRVVRRVAEGGMGVVYEAEQDSPRRRIALKVVHPLYVTANRLKRFRQEAELLGRLQHPGIAQIYEAGSYDLGRGEQPYFAMEFVEGLDLATHCKEGQLPVSAKLSLLADICDAIQHAHEKGVIHRDLKPDNILVDENGQPKVLDFGVARATEGSTVLTTLVTEEGDLLGTIAYMAPEQLEGHPDAITTLADVYALGAIGFELLAGRLPHDLIGLPLAAAMNIARDQDPDRLGKLRPELRGDVETIVGKALEKEPARRYESPAALAADLRAFVNHRPIAARPPSGFYRAVKFTRRNSTLVGGFAATLIATLIGLGIALSLRADSEANASLARHGERRAVAATLQATQDALENGSYWPASLLYNKLAPQPGDWTYELVGQALPNMVPLGHWFGSEAIISTSRTKPGLGVYDIEQRTETRRIFPGAKFRNSISSGQPLTVGEYWVAYEGPELVHLDPETGTVKHRFRPSQPDVAVRRIYTSIDENGLYIDRYLDPTSDSWIVEREGHAPIRLELGTLNRSGLLSASPDGNHAAILAGDEGVLAIYDLHTGELRGTVLGLRKSECERMYFTPDSATILTFSQDRMVSVDVEEIRIVRSHDYFRVGHCAGGSLSADGRLFAVEPPIGAPIQVWDIEEEKLVYSAKVELLHGSGSTVTFSPDGRHLRVEVRDTAGCVLDLQQASPEPQSFGTEFDPRILTYRGHEKFVYTLAVSPDGQLVASSSVAEPYVRLWDATDGETLALLEKPVASDYSIKNRSQMMAFTANGRRLVATAREGVASPELLAWDLLTGRAEKKSLPQDVRSYSHLSLLDQFIEEFRDEGPKRLGRRAWMEANGNVLAVQQYTILDSFSGKLWKTFVDHNEEEGLALSPNGDLVAVSAARTLRIYDRATASELQSFPGPTHCADWSPDGKLIAAGGTDGRIRLIDTEYWVEILSFKAHDDYVFSIAWTPDGTRLISASGDKTVRVWDPRSGKAKASAQKTYSELLEPLRAFDSEALLARFEHAKTTEERGAVVRAALELRRDRPSEE